MSEEWRDSDDPAPPRGDLDKATPDLLHGFDNAPAGLQHVLRDAVKRLEAMTIMHGAVACGRISDIRIHVQPLVQYADRNEKSYIKNAATRLLDEYVGEDGMKPTDARWDEAMATLQKEDERVFVAIVMGTPRHLVYWNWKFAYSVDNNVRTRRSRLFRRDAAKRHVASAEHARKRYGADAVRTADEQDGHGPPHRQPANRR